MLLYEPNAVLGIRSWSHFFYQCMFLSIKAGGSSAFFIDLLNNSTDFFYMKNYQYSLVKQQKRLAKLMQRKIFFFKFNDNTH